MRSYEEVLEYMYSQLPMYQRIGQEAFKKDLTNIIAFCDHLNNPHQKFRSIHVGGTNGKGTVTHLIAFFLQCQGLKVGVYTSPHYKDFRERIKINGEYISKHDVVAFIDSNETAIKAIQPSFFEITVAMAFDYFAKQEVDVAIIEVGLGGRLDSTNIITPLLSIITNISFDHMSMLGNTLNEIAFEKAGIIKPNVPTLIGEFQPEVASVFKDKAADVHAPIQFADQMISIEHKQGSIYVFLNAMDTKTIIDFPLQGEFQLKNLKTAICAGLILDRHFSLQWDKIFERFDEFQKSTGYMGRWQMIHKTPDILVDSAHNEAGIEYLSQFFKTVKEYEKFHLVLGFANDKDLSKILTKFPIKATYYFAKADVPRGLKAKVLREKASEFNLIGNAYSSVNEALLAAKDNAGPNDLVFVGGSIFVVAEVL